MPEYQIINEHFSSMCKQQACIKKNSSKKSGFILKIHEDSALWKPLHQIARQI